ncbi:hypothetical protein [Muricoccus radiodurans]|uniref:hypothetical protein n=1 Tax=Muricoccus radiodurans TaxID=2231721 RepID=UPI003CFAE136
MPITVSSGQFMTATNLRLGKTVANGWRKSSSNLIGIYNDLVELETNQAYSKVSPRERWQFMLLMACKCRLYLRRKEEKGKDLNSVKNVTISSLEASLFTQVIKERNKADSLGQRVNQYNSGPGVIMGRNNPHHGKVRFEHALGGGKTPALPNGRVANGQKLWDLAVAENVRFTGDDNRDAFILRAWMKQKAAAGSLLKIIDPLEYADAASRQQYELAFGAQLVSQGGAPFNTLAGFTQDEAGSGPFAIGLDGTWYAKAGKFNNMRFHHSSFLSGQPVMLAGTIRCASGRLLYISNNSGHYAPRIADLVNGARELRHIGLDQATRHQVSILAADFEGLYGAKAGSLYLFPYTTFSRLRGAVPNPQNYAVNVDFSELYWENPGASRPHHPVGVGAGRIVNKPNAAPIVWP